MVEATRAWTSIYVGGLEEARSLARRNPHDVKTVISLSAQTPRKHVRDIRYVHIPIPFEHPIPRGVFEAVMDEITSCIRRGTVLIHSFSGRCRAPIMAAAWMHQHKLGDFEQTLRAIAARGRDIDPSPVLLASVKESLG